MATRDAHGLARPLGVQFNHLFLVVGTNLVNRFEALTYLQGKYLLCYHDSRSYWADILYIHNS